MGEGEGEGERVGIILFEVIEDGYFCFYNDDDTDKEPKLIASISVKIVESEPDIIKAFQTLCKRIVELYIGDDNTITVFEKVQKDKIIKH